MILRDAIKYINSPYPCQVDNRNYFKVPALFGGFVALFLFLFQPFGLQGLSTQQLAEIAASFGMVTFVSLLFVALLVFIFKDWFVDEHWTLAKELLFGTFNFFVVANGNYLFTRYGWYSKWLMFDYWQGMGVTVMVGLIPYLGWILFNQLRLAKKHLKAADKINIDIAHQSAIVSSNHATNTVEIAGDAGEDALVLDAMAIVMIKADANYVDVYHLQSGRITRNVLRTTLQNIELNLGSYPFLMRVHRSYVVNLSRITKVDGNSQGYRLHLDHGLEEVPVARTRNQEFRAAIGQLG